MPIQTLQLSITSQCYFQLVMQMLLVRAQSRFRRIFRLFLFSFLHSIFQRSFGCAVMRMLRYAWQCQFLIVLLVLGPATGAIKVSVQCIHYKIMRTQKFTQFALLDYMTKLRRADCSKSYHYLVQQKQMNPQRVIHIYLGPFRGSKNYIASPILSINLNLYRNSIGVSINFIQYLNIMGNSNAHHFDRREWEFVSKPSTYDIVTDRRTGIYAEKHIVPNNPTINEQDQMEIYYYRNLTNKPIVKVYDASYLKQGTTGACGAAKDILVYSQYIPHRLSDLKNLNHGQALYILSQALTGFHELHHRFGPFQITDNHIGFNEIGQTKVWHSPNFATNRLEREAIILMSTVNPKNFDDRMIRRQEEEMVEDIWIAVENHANISHQFQNRTNCFRELGFVEARRLVAEQISKGSIYVPQYLNFKDSRGSAIGYSENLHQDVQISPKYDNPHNYELNSVHKSQYVQQQVYCPPNDVRNSPNPSTNINIISRPGNSYQTQHQPHYPYQNHNQNSIVFNYSPRGPTINERISQQNAKTIQNDDNY